MGAISPTATAGADAGADCADFTAPPTIPHYEAGATTTRTILHRGKLWSVTYFAEHDGAGWLVHRAECHPEETPLHVFHEGDVVHVRVKIVEDAGDMVKFAAETSRGRTVFWEARSLIVRTEGRASPD